MLSQRQGPPARNAGSVPIAWRPLLLITFLFAVLELVLAGGYGYHRDELYFVAIGGHPAFGYTDEPPLVPLLAHGMDAAFGHSLVWLRVPAALAGALAVLVTGLIAREFGARAPGQALAAGCFAVAGFTLGTSHLMSTTTFDLLAWTVLLWLVIRALRDGGRSWLLVGLVAGVALEIKTLPVFLLFALVIGVLAVGPRTAFGDRWLWAAAVIAVAIWTPNLVWQATHDWPQLKLSTSIASGKSGSSQPRALFVPFQFLLMSPPLCPIWLAGLWRLGRDRELRPWRCLLIAYAVLVVVFVATGGKPYYLCGMYPVLFAAGAQPTLRWMREHAWRRRTVLTVLGVAAVVDALVALPIVPARDLHNTPIVAMNYDAGEQVGWPRFAAAVTGAYRTLPAAQRADAVVIGGNYGEAGALFRFRPDLAHVYGAQNSLWDLGPPAKGTATALVLDYSKTDLQKWFRSVRPIATIDNGVHLDNDEQGRTIWLCSGPTRPWPALWHAMRNLG